MRTLNLLISLAMLAPTVAPLTAEIPFPKALEEANVSLPSMDDGQGESLMLGNGDLYGVVWEKDGGLTMRVTKNDIWDARVDTSKDGPLPKVDVATGKVTGSTGAPPSYGLLYPQPRCAAALRFGTAKPGSHVSWNCIRAAAKHSFTMAPGGTGAIMQVSGAVGASTGYRARLGNVGPVSTLHFNIKGSANAQYYVNIFNKAGQCTLATGWQKTPANTKRVELTIPAESIGMLELYAWTTDGKVAKNHVDSLTLSGADSEKVIPLPRKTSNPALLDLRRAVATINKATTIRILADRNVVLIDTPHAISIEDIKAATLPAAELGKTDGVSWLLMKMPGDVDYRGMVYAVAVAGQGSLKAVSVVTSFDTKNGDVLGEAIALARDTLAQKEGALIAVHEKAWEAFWSRSGVDLADKDLQRWWYRMLYFANTVCKPGAAPVALMPPLATDATPWHADYHHNYNAWQAFWPLPAANHAELADPWISYVHDMLPRFRWLAKETYDIDGVFFPISSFLHEPDPDVCKSKNGRQMSMNPWGLTIGMVGMTIQSMWQKHLCEPDPEYLEEKIYPTLREGARFYVAFMERCKRDDKGKVLLGPSYSPEHGPMGICNCPFDIAYVHYTFDAFIRASDELERDEALAARCRRCKALLGDYPTAMDKSGKAVVVDWQDCRYRQVGQHNIEVPASPVFPGDQVTWFSPEREKDLFRRTIADTRHTGANSHVMFNIAKARLSMPQAVNDAKAFFLPRTLPNGFIRMPWAHGTYMQEMIGVVGLVNEFLLQSIGDVIRVFPAWPEERDAAFVNLRAQGGFMVSAEQKGGKVVKLEITSTVGGILRVVSPWSQFFVNGTPQQLDGQGIVTLATEAKDVLTLTGSE